MDTFNSNSLESQVSNAKLTIVTEKQVWRKQLQEATVHQNLFPPRQSVGIPMIKTTGIRPSTRNLCLFQSNRTQRVTHNQGSPFLADTPKGRKGWANTSKPQVRTQTQLSRVGSQGAGICSAANTGKLEDSNPHIVYIDVPRL